MFSTRHVLLWFFLVPAWNRITSIQLAWTSPRRYWDEKHKCWIEANIFWTQILLIGALNMGGVIVNTLLLSSYDTYLYGSAESAKWPHTRKSKWHTTGKLWDFFMFSSGIPLIGFLVTWILNSLQILLPRNDRNAVIVFELRILESTTCINVLSILLHIKIDLAQIEICFESCTVLEVLEMRILFHIVVCTRHLLDYLLLRRQRNGNKQGLWRFQSLLRSPNNRFFE